MSGGPFGSGSTNLFQPSDALHTRLMELMNVETNFSMEEKGQLANNLCLVIRKVHNPQSDVDLLGIFLVLGDAEEGDLVMTFINGQHSIKGMRIDKKLYALHGLSLEVDERIANISNA